MREHGVQMRYDAEHSVIVWKPLPKRWPESMRQEMFDRSHDLIALLVPGTNPYEPPRSGWSLSSLAACVGCDSSVALRDPLNQPRHVACGYLGQSANRAPTQHSASQRKMRKQG